jgi:hypothetical protein
VLYHDAILRGEYRLVMALHRGEIAEVYFWAVKTIGGADETVD